MRFKLKFASDYSDFKGRRNYYKQAGQKFEPGEIKPLLLTLNTLEELLEFIKKVGSDVIITETKELMVYDDMIE